MERKKLNTILIVAVALIWGIVIYKFAAPYFMKKEPVLTAEVLVKKPIELIQKKDTVALVFPDRDPFLGRTVTLRKPRPQPATLKKTSKSNVISKPVQWPKIAYMGFVKSQSSKGRLGLVRIDGKLHRVQSGMVVNGIKISRVDVDEIRVKNGREERVFKRN